MTLSCLSTERAIVCQNNSSEGNSVSCRAWRHETRRGGGESREERGRHAGSVLFRVRRERRLCAGRRVDHASIAAASLAINATGAVQTTTIVLLTPEDVDQATKKKVKYRAPGQ